MGDVEKIIADIRSLKIQGATNVAKAGVRAYALRPTKKTRELLMNARPTEPLLFNALKQLKKYESSEVLAHLADSQDAIASYTLEILKRSDVIMTHCHSSTVTKALIAAKREGVQVKVCATETRPRYQGRKTARELSNASIPVTFFVDGAMPVALDHCDCVMIGADALLDTGVVNKVGSLALAELAYARKIPVYVLADSWKYSGKKIIIEQRDSNEVWKNSPKGIAVKNPAFDTIPAKFVTKIISEKGVKSYKSFLKLVD